MSTTNVLISLFLVMLAGVAAGKTSLFNEEARNILSRFVFYIATSALILGAILSLNMAELSRLPFFIATNIIVYGVLFLMVYLGLRLLKIPYRFGASILYSSTTANTIYLGLPLIRALYGSEGILFAVALLTVPSAVADLLAFYFLNRWRDGKAPIRKVLRDFVINPLVFSTILGFILLGLGIRLPVTIKYSLDLLGSGASGLALFAMGLFLATTPLRGFKLKLASLSTTIKLVVAPLIALGVGRVVGMSGMALAVTVIMAALPSAVFCMVVATEYDFDERATADTILLSSVLFLLTSMMWVSLVR